jgi:protein-disulfide isomerase
MASGLMVRQTVLRHRARRRARLVSALAVCFVGFAAVLGFTAYQAQTAPPSPPARVPAGAIADKSGLQVGSGPVRVDIYFDYLCPACRRAEGRLGPLLGRLLQSRTIRIIYHPLGYLDGNSVPAGYSTRAASAAACAADDGKFPEYTKALFAVQPPEESAGLTEAKLITVGARAGLTLGSFAACVRSQEYKPWAQYVTQVAENRNISATPTVLVDGQHVDVSAANGVSLFAAAVSHAKGRPRLADGAAVRQRVMAMGS